MIYQLNDFILYMDELAERIENNFILLTFIRNLIF